MSGSVEWHKARSKGVGGSDWSDILMYQYGCQRKLWYEKTGQEADFEREETGAMRRGHLLEPIVAEEFERITGMKTRKVGRLPKTDLPSWWIGNIDYGIVSEESGPGVLEIKTCNPWVYRIICQEGTKEEHIAQLQHYLALTGRSWGCICYLEPVDWHLRPSFHQRDDDLINVMRFAGDSFWRKVENGPAPAQLDPKDPVCHKCSYRITCQGDALWGTAIERGKDEEVDDDTLRELLGQYDEINGVYKEADLLLRAKRGELLEQLGQNPRKVLCDGRPIHVMQTTSKRFDCKRFAKDYPDLEPKYVNETKSEPFIKVFG